MTISKRIAALITAVCLLAAMPALADGGRALMLSATVDCVSAYAVKAPFSGELKEFALRAGDTVTKGDTLFTVEEKTLYSPMDGTVGAVFARAGDTMGSVNQRYGAVIMIDPVNRYRIECNARTGYNSVITRDIRVGAHVYVKTAEGDKRTGEGDIIAVNGSNFTVELTSGDLLFDDNVYVFIGEEMKNSQKLSRGTVSAAPPVAISGSGTVTRVNVKRGDAVKRGDRLLSYVPDDMAQGVPSGAIKADKDGVIQSVSATQGMTVNKGQVLAQVYDTESIVLSAQLSESDMLRVAIGDAAVVTFEELPSLEPIAATVRSISALGSQGETASYTVLLDFVKPDVVRIGMHATVTIE